MTREVSRWGVGPSILVSAGEYAAVAGIATWLWPEVCLITAVPYPIFLVAGIVLVTVGIPMLMSSFPGGASHERRGEDQEPVDLGTGEIA